ncbi:GntR family transcriptional regulator [Paraglaciecola chathamensis]|uniref:GntR family transcriptional regulator n=1 Tax=Paraglaciecola chathamensis TaxID=368405 RepID=UPI0026F6915D|nr:GntR family transcriptional regulator [Paraglaciecola chathamensis]MDO6840552.1 GntR family transcriptional regulator [Paraglaciecola chathamensis]
MNKPMKTSAIPLSEKAYQTIRALILENEFRAGDQILEKVLVEKLNISRTPIREACVQLEKEGLIEIRPRRGIFIKPISGADMNEIYDIMTALEAQAAKILAEKVANNTITEKELEQLELPTLRMEKALQQDNLKEWAEADEEFHLCLLELCGNVRLKQVVLQFWGQAHRVRYFTLELRNKPTDSTADHIAVVEAIRAGDAKRAGEIHSLHRQKGKQNLLGIIEKYRFDHL